MPIGFSYSPGADIQMNGNGGGRGSSPSRLSPQQAVKILSLRVPPTLPANAPVNRSLLTSPGGSAPGAGAFQSFIQQLIQGGGLGGQQQAPPPMQQAPFSAGGGPRPSPGEPPAQTPFMTPNAPAPYNPFPGGNYAPSPMTDTQQTPAQAGGGGGSFDPKFIFDDFQPLPGLDFNPGLMNPRSLEWMRQPDGWAGPTGG